MSGGCSNLALASSPYRHPPTNSIWLIRFLLSSNKTHISKRSVPCPPLPQVDLYISCKFSPSMGCRLCEKRWKFVSKVLTIYVNITWYLYMSVDIYYISVDICKHRVIFIIYQLIYINIKWYLLNINWYILYIVWYLVYISGWHEYFIHCIDSQGKQ